MKCQSVFCLSRMLSVLLLSVVLSTPCLQAADDPPGVEIRLAPVDTTVQNGIVTFRAVVHFQNNLSQAVSNVTAVASSAAGICIEPEAFTVSYIPSHGSVASKDMLTLVYPAPRQDEGTGTSLRWAVEYDSQEVTPATQKTLSIAEAPGAMPQAGVAIVNGSVLPKPYAIQTNGESVLIGGDSYATAPAGLSEPDTAEFLRISRQTLETSLARGDVLLLGEGYEIILTGEKRTAFFRSASQMTDVDDWATAVDQLVSAIGSACSGLREDLLASFDPLTCLLQGDGLSAAPAAKADLSPGSSQAATLDRGGLRTAGLGSPGSRISACASGITGLETPGSRTCVMFRPYAWQLNGFYGNKTYSKVKSVMLDLGYDVADYSDSAITVALFRQEMLNQHGVVYVNTHGSSSGFAMEVFKVGDYGPKYRSTLTAGLWIGATDVQVGSTDGFPSSGTAYIVDKIVHSLKDKFQYTGKTATSFTGVTGVDAPHTRWDEEVWNETEKEAAYRALTERLNQYEALTEYSSTDLNWDCTEDETGNIDSYYIEVCPSLVQKFNLNGSIVYLDACESASLRTRKAMDSGFMRYWDQSCSSSLDRPRVAGVGGSSSVHWIS